MVEKELLPYIPFIFEKILLQILCAFNYYLDMDDAVHLRYLDSSNPIIRFLLKDKIAKIVKYAKHVTVGSIALERYCSAINSSNISLIGTSIPLSKYFAKSNQYRSGKLVVGWIGTPQTQLNLAIIVDTVDAYPQLLELCEIVAIGADSTYHPHIFRHKTWSEETELLDLQSIDVGIMPLPISNWTESKCAYKIIQYLAVGKPFITSPPSFNRHIASATNAGFVG